MSGSVTIELLPLGKRLVVERGTALQDILFVHGVEFPCGGQGRCKGCRVRVLSGSLPVNPEEERRLTPAELAAGWRMACRHSAEGNLRLEMAQWEAAILSDNSTFSFTPCEGWGIAIDLGTTTVVAQLVDLRTGDVLAVRSALNAQARHGADIMSRVEFAVAKNRQTVLEKLIRRQLGELVRELVEAAVSSRAASGNNAAATTPGENGEVLKAVVVVGNTVMHHLFCGLSVEPLSHVPFEPEFPELREFKASQLGWTLPGDPPVRFLPCLGGFVGSDILAGVLATGLHEAETLTALLR